MNNGLVVNSEACPDSKQPELKACAVRVLRVGAEVIETVEQAVFSSIS